MESVPYLSLKLHGEVPITLLHRSTAATKLHRRHPLLHAGDPSSTSPSPNRAHKKVGLDLLQLLPHSPLASSDRSRRILAGKGRPSPDLWPGASL